MRILIVFMEAMHLSPKLEAIASRISLLMRKRPNWNSIDLQVL
jgi:hypothetical protein